MVRERDRIPSVVFDRGVTGLGQLGDMVLHADMTFGHHLDEDRLERALRLILDAQPVLGTRWVHRYCRPYWERLPAGFGEVLHLVQDETDLLLALRQPVEVAVGPQIRGYLWRREEGDRLLLKINHVLADAGGVKEITTDLSTIYSRLKDDPDYTPEPNWDGSRSLLQVLRHVPLRAWPRVFVNTMRDMRNLTHPVRSLSLPIEEGPHGLPLFLSLHLDEARVKALSAYGRERNATLNDIMVSAFFRALVSETQWDRKAWLKAYGERYTF